MYSGGENMKITVPCTILTELSSNKSIGTKLVIGERISRRSAQHLAPENVKVVDAEYIGVKADITANEFTEGFKDKVKQYLEKLIEER